MMYLRLSKDQINEQTIDLIKMVCLHGSVEIYEDENLDSSYIEVEEFEGTFDANGIEWTTLEDLMEIIENFKWDQPQTYSTNGTNPRPIQPQEVQIQMDLEKVKEAYEDQDSRYIARVWKKDGKQRVYLHHNNGIRTIQYGYLEWHPETSDSIAWIELNQQRATVGYKNVKDCIEALKKLGYTNFLTEMYVCRRFEREILFK